MNIPIDRLYHYIERVAQDIYSDNVIIYRFWPHGSKNIDNLTALTVWPWQDLQLQPLVYCCDQEPLDYDFYSIPMPDHHNHDWGEISKNPLLAQPWNNISRRKSNIFEKNILVHSEQRSTNLEKYQESKFIPVYYWAHGLIARDWFRYAEHELFQKNVQKKFLIYNRAWSGSREYRLKFTDLLIQKNLIEQCKTNCNPVDNQIHYQDYKFINPQWRPDNVLENYCDPTTATSTCSADFDTNDYKSTEIEVVLETLFDDGRLHITEKSLRPIACGQPFILTSTVGSLQYLKEYGFKTFDTVWNEGYDTIKDPKQRMIAIVNLMQDISQWSEDEYTCKMAQAVEIANYNKKYFFSSDFFNLVVDELKNNMSQAFDELEKCNNFKQWATHWEHVLTYPALKTWIENNKNCSYPTLQQVTDSLNLVRQKN